MTVGQLRNRIDFQIRQEGEDEYGNPQSGQYETKGSAWAHFKYLRGGETVMAGRLQGKQPAIITVRQDEFTRTVNASFRIKTEDGMTWNIRAVTDPDGRRAWLEILAESGVAT